MKTKAAPTTGKTKTKTAGSAKARRISVQAETWTKTEEIPMMMVSMMVPAAVARILPHGKGLTFIDSISFGYDDDVKSRIHHWAHSHTLYPGRVSQPWKVNLEEILREKLDTMIKVPVDAVDWSRIEAVAKGIGITPGDWLLSCAQYNAKVERRHQSKKAAAA